jgi:hypothetical protein
MRLLRESAGGRIKLFKHWSGLFGLFALLAEREQAENFDLTRH